MAAATNPGTIHTFLLVARRFLLGAPKLRYVGVYGVECLDNYELDVIDIPLGLGARRRPKRMDPTMTTSSLMGSSFLIQQQQQQQHQQHQQNIQPSNPMIAHPTTRSVDDYVEPYHLEPINFDPETGAPRAHVPSYYESPHWRPDP
jgi:hypothetical protein